VFSQPSLSLPRSGGCPPALTATEPIRSGLLRFAAFEFALWASLYGAYLAVRGATIGSPATALENGRDIVALERALGLFHEVQIQHALSALERVFSAYYMAGFAPLIAATLVWLAVRRPQHYRELRTTLLISISIATVVFVVFPAAPPRLIPDLGIVDTVGLSGHDTGSFAGVRFNPYAAMPSMHVGWSLLVGLAGFRAARRRVVRLFFAVHPFVMVLTVTATGNHFALDAVAGAAIASVVAGLVLASRRRPASETAHPLQRLRRSHR
jgi:PAP2 superfamily